MLTMAKDTCVLKPLLILFLGILHPHLSSCKYYRPSSYDDRYSIYRPQFDDDYDTYRRPPYAPPPMRFFSPPKNPFWDQLMEVFNYDGPWHESRPYWQYNPYDSQYQPDKYIPQEELAPQRNPTKKLVPQEQYVPQRDPQNEYVPQHGPQDDYGPQRGPQNEYVPQRGPQNEYVPQRGPQNEYVPQSAPQEDYVPQRGPQDELIPQRGVQASGGDVSKQQHEEAYNRYKDYFYRRYGTNSLD